MASIVSRYRIDTIFNLVALLSAVGEKNPSWPGRSTSVR